MHIKINKPDYINPMTLKLEGDLDILRMYIHIENEVARLKHSKLLTVDEIKDKIALRVKGQRSRSNITNFHSLLALTVGHIPTKLHQLLISSSRDEILCGHTHTHLDRRRH